MRAASGAAAVPRGCSGNFTVQVAALLKKNAKIHMRQGVGGSCCTCKCFGGAVNPLNAMCIQLCCPIGFVMLITVLPYVLLKSLLTNPDEIFEIAFKPLTYHAPYPDIPLIFGSDDPENSGRRRTAVKGLSESYAGYDGKTFEIRQEGVEGGFPLEDLLFANNRIDFGCHCKTLAVVGGQASGAEFTEYLQQRYETWKEQNAALPNVITNGSKPPWVARFYNSAMSEMETTAWNNCEVAGPGYAEPIIRHFQTEEEVEKWIAEPSYGTYSRERSNMSSIDRICAAVVLENNVLTQPTPSYTIRANITAGGFKYAGGRGGSRLGPLQSFFTADGADFVLDERNDNTQALTWYKWSGFLALQHLMHGFLLSKRGCAGLVVPARDFECVGGLLPAEDLLGGEPHFTTMPVYSSKTQQFAEQMGQLVSDPFMMTLQFAPSVAMIAYYLCRERQSKQREIMKMMGLGDFPLIFSWMLLFGILNFVIAIAGTVFVGAFYVNKSNLFILFLIYYLFSMAMIAFGMTIAAIVSNERMGSVAAFGLFFLTGFFSFTVSAFDPSVKKVFTALLPAAAFQMTFDTYMTLDASSIGCYFSTADKMVANFSVAWGLTMLFLDIIFWLVLYAYLDQVVPWHGVGVVRKPWFFLLPSFWRSAMGCSGESELLQGVDYQPSDELQSKFFESEDTANLKHLIAQGRAVVVKGLCKDFANAKGEKMHAVDKVSLRMYEGECFCLLGHNGAGKTTTMNMITGCLVPSSGSINVCGHNIPEDLISIRSQMGFCPQQNVLFDELTVDEHLWFFGRLGGRTAAQIESSSQELLASVSLLDKRHAPAKELSGGMKRKLSVAIAFLGAPHLIILDEPSSGMDPFARRGMWNTLKQRRAGNVLCITTHYMDEADELGDRIAIMSKGRIACSGTSTFLKQCYGCGYVLAIVKTTNSASRDKKIAEVVSRHCGVGVNISSAVGRELLLQIPFAAAQVFPQLFPELENSRAALGIESYGISITNLDEVFLKVGHNEESALGSNEVFLKVGTMSSASVAPEPSTSAADLEAADPQEDDMKDRKRASFPQQFKALAIRRLVYGMRDVKLFCLQLFVPNLCLLFFILLVSSVVVRTLPTKLLTTETWNDGVDGIKNPITVGVGSGRGIAAAARARAVWVIGGPTGVDMVHFTESVNASPGLWPNTSSKMIASLADGMEPQLREEKTFTDVLLTNAKLTEASSYGAILYASERYVRRNKRLVGTTGHSPLGLLPVLNECARLDSKGVGIVNTECVRAIDANVPSTTIFANHTSFHAAPTIFNTHASAILKVRTAGAAAPISDIKVSNHPFALTTYQNKNVNSAVGAFISIMILCAYSFIPAGIISFIVMEKEREVTQLLYTSGCGQFAYWSSNALFDCLFGVVSMGGTMIVLQLYSNDMQNFLGDPGAAATVTLLLSFGVAATTSSYLLSHAFTKAGTALTVTLIGNLVSGFVLTLVIAVLSLLDSTKSAASTLTWIFRIIPSYCLGNGILQIGLFGGVAKTLNVGPLSGVATGGKNCPLGAKEHWECIYLVGDDVLMLWIMSFVFFSAAFLWDFCWQQPGFRRMLESSGSQPPASDDLEDEDVITEKSRVNDLDPASQILCVKNIRKVYNKTLHAVRGISFAAAEGQVFGLLGVNGAGKTTTFKMLCGQYVPTAGTIHVRGRDVSQHVHEVRKMIGYCPQFDAILDELTVQEHLQLYGRLKGYSGKELDVEVRHKQYVLDLNNFTNSRAGQLSGGNKRKLSVAMAVTGEPSMVFLDEPSAGMDPVARRFMWSVIQGIADRRKKSVVILTTHSMEEAEALCSRIAIQVDGLFRCMGSAQQIKSRYGQGLELNVRLRVPLSAQGHASGDAQAEEEAMALQAKKDGFEQALRTVLAKETGGSPSLTLLEGSGTSFRYQILPAALNGRFSSLGELFKLIQDNQETWALADFQISQTTLEQIFNRFAATQGSRQAELTDAKQTEPAKALSPSSSTADVATAASPTIAVAAVVGRQRVLRKEGLGLNGCLTCLGI